jgi:choline dehydrogenase-like flavoprotein
MLIDGREIPDCGGLQSDICIIGGGAAGIFLAVLLGRAGFDTLLLEAGGDSADPECQALYDGDIIGLAHDLGGSRTRQLGGSTNCWGGFCLPHEAYLLGPRPWISHAGWPMPAEEIISFYNVAAQFLGINMESFEIGTVATSNRFLLPEGTDRVSTSVSQIVGERRRIGKYFWKELRSCARIRLLLHATATALVTDGAGQRVSAVTVVTEPERRFTARSPVVILAAGAIENARLLLLSRDREPDGLANGYDLVGRYFMDHPCVDLAKIWVRDRPARAKFYDTQYAVRSFRQCLGFHVNPETQARERIAAASCFLEAEVYGEETTASASLKALYMHLRRRQPNPQITRHLLNVVCGLPAVLPLAAWHGLGVEAAVKYRALRAVIEPRPNPASRVTLGVDKDRLGMNRTCLDWRLDETDRQTVRRTAEIVCSALRKSGCMVVEPLPSALDGSWLSSPKGTWHHIGTTRMAADPRQGVVDVNCRVHTLNNLFVAGSSVFPTAGNHSPTFTILALTARLAEHVVGEFKRGRFAA